MPSIINKPQTINKQNQETDFQHKNEQVMGIAQKPFDIWYQGVCNDKDDE